MRRLVLFLVLLVPAWSLGCHGDPVGTPDEDAAAGDAGETGSDSSARDTADSSDGADAPDTNDAKDATDAPDSSDAKDASDGGPLDCVSAHGPSMVKVDVAGGGSYCIDTTEVTNAQYDEFLDGKVPTNPQPSNCDANSEWGDKNGDGTKTNAPRVWVDWCDAHAYCKWAGKRLCGKIGGGDIDLGDVTNMALDEWTYACMGGDLTQKYPYGPIYDESVCDVATGEVSVPANTKFPGCHGTKAPFDAIYDLSGNVWEWEQSCQPPDPDGGTDTCVIRGGAFAMVGIVGHEPARCDYTPPFTSVWVNGNGGTDFIGFRCCR